MEERLQKILAKAGVCSRRGAEALIQQGRVAINGVVIRQIGVKVDPSQVNITVDGKPLRLPKRCVYILLHKPRGYVTTRFDPHHPKEKTVLSLLPQRYRSLHYVGRLDKDSEGLLLLSNDGELTYKLTHPKHELPKTYQVAVRGRMSEADLRRLEEGVQLEDGRSHSAKVRILEARDEHTLLEVIIHEGKKRQIRRMLGLLGFPVRRLVRTAIGQLRLGGLPAGKFRELTPEEVAHLKGETAMG